MTQRVQENRTGPLKNPDEFLKALTGLVNDFNKLVRAFNDLSDEKLTFAEIIEKPTTLSGYGIVDAAPLHHRHPWSDIDGVPAAGSGPVAWSSITGKPYTVDGFGIVDASKVGHKHPWADILDPPPPGSGPAGPAGADGAPGARGFTGSAGLPGLDGRSAEPLIFPGPAGKQGKDGKSPPPVVWFETAAALEPLMMPGLRGSAGPAGAAGATGKAGPAVPWLEVAPPREPMMVPGSRGPAGAIGPKGLQGLPGAPSMEVAQPLEPMLVPGPRGAAGGGGGSSALLWRDGWLVGTNYAINDLVDYFGISYVALLANIGIDPTTRYKFLRASIASYVSIGGVLQIAAVDEPRNAHYINGVLQPLLIETGSTNLVPNSEDIASWASSATITSAHHVASGISLDLVADVSALNLEFTVRFLPAVFTVGVKGVSFFVKQGTSASSEIHVQDDAGTYLAFLVGWAAGLPVVTMVGVGNGTYIGYEVMAGGVFRLLFSSTNVAAPSTNPKVQFWPASDGTGSGVPTGNVDFGGVMIEDRAIPSSYIKTVAAPVARQADLVPIWTRLSGLALLTTEVNVAATPVGKRSGKFTIAGAGMSVGKPVYIQQAAGPYTGKGTRADEAEMDNIEVRAYVKTAALIEAFWSSRTRVRGNFKFNYAVGA